MKTPQEKYMHDPQYKQLADLIENQIHLANFTPSEVREISMIACINYELHRLIPHPILVTKELSNALDLVNKSLNNSNCKEE